MMFMMSLDGHWKARWSEAKKSKFVLHGLSRCGLGAVFGAF